MAEEKTIEELVLHEYRLTVRNLLLSSGQGIVANSSPRHATIILEEMIRGAKTSFIASAEQMSGEVWTDEVLRLLCEAKRRNVVIRLLVEKKCVPLAEGRLPNELVGCIRKAVDGHCDETFLNLAVMDGVAYRLELDKKTKEAAFCANGAESAAVMSDWFNREFVIAERLEVA